MVRSSTSARRKNIIGYCRVSTKLQSASGLGLEAQRQAIESFASANHHEVVEWFTETASGMGADALQRRPVLAQALARAAELGCSLAVFRLDRLSRSVSFVSHLIETNVPIIVTELGLHADPFYLQIWACIGEQEGRAISARTRAALAAAKQRGTRLGGYRNVPPPQVQGAAAARQKAQEHALQIAHLLIGICSDLGPTATLAAKARELEHRGVRTRQGGKWTATSVARVLARVPAATGEHPRGDCH